MVVKISQNQAATSKKQRKNFAGYTYYKAIETMTITTVLQRGAVRSFSDLLRLAPKVRQSPRSPTVSKVNFTAEINIPNTVWRHKFELFENYTESLKFTHY